MALWILGTDTNILGMAIKVPVMAKGDLDTAIKIRDITIKSSDMAIPNLVFLHKTLISLIKYES